MRPERTQLDCLVVASGSPPVNDGAPGVRHAPAGAEQEMGR